MTNEELEKLVEQDKEAQRNEDAEGCGGCSCGCPMKKESCEAARGQACPKCPES